MPRSPVRDVLYCCLLLAAGCGRSSPAIVQIVVERPNIGVLEMNATVADRLMIAVAGAPHALEVQSLSYFERTQIYVTLTDSNSIEVIDKRVRLALTDMPPDCRLVAIERLPDGESIPMPETGQAVQLDIRVKPNDVLQGLGVSAVDVTEAIQQTTSKTPPTGSLETFKDREVVLGARQFVLRDVADIEFVEAPKCIARGFKETR